jgi:2-amino-4-hydroxy-6-hydroxymethyldihydropteridine diphosphokinase
MATWREAFVGLGANLGDRHATLSAAVHRLAENAEIRAVESSSFYETAPVGKIDQPEFLNSVVGLETSLAPERLLHVLMDLEREFGRVRTTRWGPRTLDLDLLAYAHEERTTTALELPHPRMLERPFVLVPLRELLNRPRFCRQEWAELRHKVEAAQSSDGVRAYIHESKP